MSNRALIDRNSVSQSAISVAFEGSPNALNPDQQIELIQVLVQRYDMEDPYAGPVDSWNCGISADGRVLRYILEESGSELLKRSLQDRARYAITVCSRQAQHDILSFLSVIMDGRQIDTEICGIKDHDHRTLLHCIAWAIGERSMRVDSSHDASLGSGSPNAEEVCKEKPDLTWDYRRQLFQVLREILNIGTELHERACRYTQRAIFPEGCPRDSKETPFTALFSGFSSAQRRYAHRSACEAKDPQSGDHTVPALKRVLEPVMAWLKELENAGIDLEAYGRQEAVLRSQRQVRNHELIATQMRSDEDVMSAQVPYTKYYINFTYGAKPNDWNFWFIEMMDNSLLEFWEMVDHPERAIPGAWDESRDNWYNESRHPWCDEDRMDDDLVDKAVC